MSPDLTPIDLLWVLVCTAQVLLMQAGFCLLEAGMARAKNSINVAIKNLADLCIATVAYWVVGFGLMFGQSQGGWIGSTGFALGGDAGGSLLAFFLYQVVFCGTATTIISGAVAERIQFRGYLTISLLVSALIYPVFGHWAWGGAVSGPAIGDGTAGWLAAEGFIDFAGSTVVHSVGAWVALAVVLILGPRLGAFESVARRRRAKRAGEDSRGGQTMIQPSSLVHVVLGVLLLWFGWFGFNGGSGLGLNDRVPLILINTCVAAAAGGLAVLAIAMLRGSVDNVTAVSNGVIAGLVAITAGCHLMQPAASALIGAVAGLACVATTGLLHRARIDDVIGAVPAHGVPGVLGTLAIAWLSDPADWGNGLTRMEQFGVQATGCGSAMLWAGGGALVIFSLINLIIPFRVGHRDEVEGLNVAEHGAGSELLSLIRQMSGHRRSRDFGSPVRFEPSTDLGRVSASYNRVLAAANEQIQTRTRERSQMAAIIENAFEGIYQTNPDGSFRSVNPAMATLCGFGEPAEMLRDRAVTADSLYDWPDHRRAFLEAISVHGSVREFASQIRRRDGSVISILENARAVRNDAGRLEYYEGTAVDVTNRIAGEQIEQMRAAAEAKTRAKSDFLAGISHEMRTPLNGIINLLGLMEGHAEGPQRDQYIRLAKTSADSLLAIINDILDLAKIESAELRVERVGFDLQQTLDQTVEILYHTAVRKGLPLRLDVDPAVATTATGDSLRIQQVLTNLISNAIKFTALGGVSIRVSPSDRQPVENAAWLHFKVADSGIGIDAERLQAVFEPFVQADASTSRRFGGSGLGLSICRNLVEAMGGEIGVESELGRGTKFWFELPIVDSVMPGRRLDADPAGVTDIGGQSVLLVVGDEDESRRLGDLCERMSLSVERYEIRGVPPSRPRYDTLLIDADLIVAASTELIDVDFGARVQLGVSESQDDPLDPASRCDAVMLQPIGASRLFETLVACQTSDPVAPGRGTEQETGETDRTPPITSAKEPFISLEFAQGDSEYPTALVVDDNEINRIVAAELLRVSGWRAVCVDGGQKAILQMKQQAHPLILMDCEMPEMDGLQCTREIRRLHRAGALSLPADQSLRIIAVTAQAMPHQIESFIAAGMDAYLCKPLDRDALAEKLTTLGPGPASAGGAASTAEPTPAGAPIPLAAPTPAGAAEVPPPFDYDDLLYRCGGSDEAAREVLAMFGEQLPGQIAEIRRSVSTGDQTALREQTHRLKGVAANLSCAALALPTKMLHQAAHHEATATPGPPLTAVSDDLHRHMTDCLDWIEAKLAEANR